MQSQQAHFGHKQKGVAQLSKNMKKYLIIYVKNGRLFHCTHEGMSLLSAIDNFQQVQKQGTDTIISIDILCKDFLSTVR